MKNRGDTIMATREKSENKILWFVKYGPDPSHMWEAKPFNKLKDAREFANNLPLSPTGDVRPFMIERYEYIQSRVYGDVVKIRNVYPEKGE